MNYFLAKTDPESYSIDQFQADLETVWNGVKNAQAVQALKAMKVGDLVFIYHSQGEGAIRGLAKVTKVLGVDPEDAKSFLVKLKLQKVFTEPYVTLKSVKESGEFKDLLLVRNSRLSTMPLPEKFAHWVLERCQ